MRIKIIAICFIVILAILGAGAGVISFLQNKQQSAPLPAKQKIEANITITSPAVNETVDFPFTIKGQARVFESTLNIRLKDYRKPV